MKQEFIDINTQIEMIAKFFHLESKKTLEYARKLPELPRGAEGWFAIPKLSAIAKKYFFEVTDAETVDMLGLYEAASAIVVQKVNSRGGNIGFFNYKLRNSGYIERSARTIQAFAMFEKWQTEGDILCIPGQLGTRHQGKSAHGARDTFDFNEFGLGIIGTGCVLLTHTELFKEKSGFGLYCVGDEFCPTKEHTFFRSPVFYGVGEKGSAAFADHHHVAVAREGYGTVSGFLLYDRFGPVDSSTI